MAYIGKSPIIGNFVKLDAITAVNGQAAYTMQNGGANFTDYETVNQFLVSLNGTIQAPTDSFTVSGSTLTFASNLSTGDVIDFIIVFGNSLSAGTPTDGTVTAAKLNSTAITGQTAEATVANDDTVLIHDTSASALRKMTVSNLVANAGGGKINQVVYTSSAVNQNVSSDTELMSLAITPSASDSKVLIIYTGAVQLGANEYGSFDIYRGSLASGTKVLDGGESTFNSADLTRFGFSLNYLDSPSTTSATTYTIVGVPNGTVQFGATAANTLTLMEVLA